MYVFAPSLRAYDFLVSARSITCISTLSLHDALPICGAPLQRRVQQRTPSRHGPDGAGDVGGAEGLQQVPGGVRHHRGEECVVVVERGQDQAPYARVRLPDISAQVDTVAVWQHHVQHCDIGAGGRDPAPRLRAAGRLSDHLEVRLQVQDTGNTAADDLMVIDEEDPGHQPPPITPALESWHRCGMDTGVYRATHRLARDLLATLVGPRTQLRARGEPKTGSNPM